MLFRSEYKSAVKKKMQNAYAMSEYNDARRALDRLHCELMELNPSAARSLEEGIGAMWLSLLLRGRIPL